VLFLFLDFFFQFGWVEGDEDGEVEGGEVEDEYLVFFSSQF